MRGSADPPHHRRAVFVISSGARDLVSSLRANKRFLAGLIATPSTGNCHFDAERRTLIFLCSSKTRSLTAFVMTNECEAEF
jgi:hypothetical protein